MATKKLISVKSVFYTAVSLVWIFGLSAIGHIVMVLIERYTPGIKYDFARACAIIGILALYSTRWINGYGGVKGLFIEALSFEGEYIPGKD